MPAGIRTVLSGHVTGMKFSPDGSTLYAVVGKSIFAIDVGTRAIVERYTFDQELGGFDVSADGSQLSVIIDEYVDGHLLEFVTIDLATGGREQHVY